MNYEIILLIFSLVLVPGIIMSFIPGLPGLIYMSVVALIFGAVTDFSLLSANNLYWLLGIALGAMLLDLIAGLIGARYGGAHIKSLAGGVIGLILGTFLLPLPPLGTFIGFFLGIFIIEYINNRHNTEKAFRAALGGFLGSVFGTAITATASIVFFIMFIIYALN